MENSKNEKRTATTNWTYMYFYQFETPNSSWQNFREKKNLKKTMSYKQENQLGAKNKANFDVFQNPDVKLVFKIDVKRIQWRLNFSVCVYCQRLIWMLQQLLVQLFPAKIGDARIWCKLIRCSEMFISCGHVGIFLALSKHALFMQI